MNTVYEKEEGTWNMTTNFPPVLVGLGGGLGEMVAFVYWCQTADGYNFINFRSFCKLPVSSPLLHNSLICRCHNWTLSRTKGNGWDSLI